MSRDIALWGALPIYFISAWAVISLLVDAFSKNSRVSFHFAWIGLLLTAIAAVGSFPYEGAAFSGMIATGHYAAFFDVLFAIGGLLTVLAAHPYLERLQFELDEFYSLTLFAIAGMMLIAHANNLLVLFIGIEVMSISFYILAGYFRNKTLSVEAGIKYFLLGAFMSGFLMYGIALVYGATASLHYGAILHATTTGSLSFPTLLIIGATFLVIALSFKAALFPFHFWAPDVYQGAPTVVTGLMSTAGKAAAFAAFLPLAFVFLPQLQIKLQLLLAIIAALSMLYGNIVAITQQNIKRMLAYSSIAHAGYILIGIVAASPDGFAAVTFYATVYLFMQLGAFVLASVLEQQYGRHLEIQDYKGLYQRHPLLAGLMAVFMFSLTGVPPLAGFFGKYYLFVAAIESGFVWLAILGVVASVISAYFYLGLVVAMFFHTAPESSESSVPAGTAGITLAISTLMTFLFGFFPSLLLHVAQQLF